MNQYQERKLPALLKSTKESTNSFKLNNGLVEFTIDGERVVVPTAEAFQRLLKKVAVLEQRLYSTDNKVARTAKARE
jgi:hypothetical protein